MRYMLVIKTESAESALQIARNIQGFQLDESWKPRSFKKNEFIVRGEADEKPEGHGVTAFPDGPRMQPTEPQLEKYPEES